MPLIARASTTVRNKNLLIVIMCAVFLCWFSYDGFVGYARTDDILVRQMTDRLAGQIKALGDAHREPSATDLDNLRILQAWPGWDHADPASRDRMTNLAKNEIRVEGWRGGLDIQLQRWIVLALAAATIGSIAWFIQCQRRRAIAEETTISPTPGVVIPWDKITRVDNTRWKSHGIVEITYTDAAGIARLDWLDDYKLQAEPLLAILDQLSERAINAEFIPKEMPASSTTASPTAPPPTPPPPPTDPTPRGS